MKSNTFRLQQFKDDSLIKEYISLTESRILAYEDTILAIQNLIYNEKQDLKHAKSVYKKRQNI